MSLCDVTPLSFGGSQVQPQSELAERPRLLGAVLGDFSFSLRREPR